MRSRHIKDNRSAHFLSGMRHCGIYRATHQADLFYILLRVV